MYFFFVTHSSEVVYFWVFRGHETHLKRKDSRPTGGYMLMYESNLWLFSNRYLMIQDGVQ